MTTPPTSGMSAAELAHIIREAYLAPIMEAIEEAAREAQPWKLELMPVLKDVRDRLEREGRL